MSQTPSTLQAKGPGNKNDNVDVNADGTDENFMFKQRTFDVFWVDKASLMYKDGIAKVRVVAKAVCDT